MILTKSNILRSALPKRASETRTVSIALYVFLSFTNQLFSHIIGSNSLLIASLFLTALVTIFINARNELILQFIDCFWLTCLVMVVVNSLRTVAGLDYFSINEYVGMFVFFAGVVLILFSGYKSENFNFAFKIILLLSIIFSISIWVQILLPQIYDKFLNLLHIDYQTDIKNWAEAGRYFTGFSTNPAFTAGHIVSGIILLISFREYMSSHKKLWVISFLFLIASLLMTGKRAHFIFSILAIMGMYILPQKGSKFFKKIINTAVVITLMAIVVFLLWDWLAQFPVFLRFSSSLNIWLEGGDISSGRISLHSHAWEQFKLNPLFGNGWGSFRLSTPGSITVEIYQQSHNIYLQLLAETGIFGFIFFMAPVVITLSMTIRGLRGQGNVDEGKWSALLNFSLAYQLFFLLYGLTGNPLYDVNYLMMYLFSCSITVACFRSRKRALIHGKRFPILN